MTGRRPTSLADAMRRYDALLPRLKAATPPPDDVLEELRLLENWLNLDGEAAALASLLRMLHDRLAEVTQCSESLSVLWMAIDRAKQLADAISVKEDVEHWLQQHGKEVTA